MAALNYALTGIVPDPDRKFESVREYEQFTKEFSDKFFDGRISEDDRTAAEISIEAEVGTKHVALARGIFDQDQLRA